MCGSLIGMARRTRLSAGRSRCVGAVLQPTGRSATARTRREASRPRKPPSGNNPEGGAHNARTRSLRRAPRPPGGRSRPRRGVPPSPSRRSPRDRPVFRRAVPASHDKRRTDERRQRPQHPMPFHDFSLDWSVVQGLDIHGPATRPDIRTGGPALHDASHYFIM